MESNRVLFCNSSLGGKRMKLLVTVWTPSLFTGWSRNESMVETGDEQDTFSSLNFKFSSRTSNWYQTWLIQRLTLHDPALYRVGSEHEVSETHFSPLFLKYQDLRSDTQHGLFAGCPFMTPLVNVGHGQGHDVSLRGMVDKTHLGHWMFSSKPSNWYQRWLYEGNCVKTGGEWDYKNL